MESYFSALTTLIKILTLLPLNWLRPIFSVISAPVIALGKSCLLANTNITASRSSSSCNYNKGQKVQDTVKLV